MSIDAARRGVEAALTDVRALADAADPDDVHGLEAALWPALLALGRALLALVLARRAPTGRARRGRGDGQLATRFGKVAVACGAPLPRGCAGGVTRGVAAELLHLCAHAPFATARRLFARFCGAAPGVRTTLRLVDAAGARAAAWLATAPPPALEPDDVLVLQVDGRGAPMLRPPELARRCGPRDRPRARAARVRRTKGCKAKNSKLAVVGVLYVLRRRARDGRRVPVHKRLVATFAGHAALFDRLAAEARRWGYGARRTVFLADGSDHIWRLQQQHFPDAEPCVDWYHVAEKLWDAGGGAYAEGSAALRAWVAAQARHLRTGGLAQVLGELARRAAAVARTGPGTRGKRDRFAAATRYLTVHAARLPYAALERDGLDLGTGAVEGAVRQLVALRLDGPGMRWGRDRAEAVVQLRCVVLNGLWDAFVASWRDAPLELAPRPAPARAYLAPANDAA